jgi:hypothetical protein
MVPLPYCSPDQIDLGMICQDTGQFHNWPPKFLPEFFCLSHSPSTFALGNHASISPW